MNLEVYYKPSLTGLSHTSTKQRVQNVVIKYSQQIAKNSAEFGVKASLNNNECKTG
jgi:hypothetical protein